MRRSLAVTGVVACVFLTGCPLLVILGGPQSGQNPRNRQGVPVEEAPPEGGGDAPAVEPAPAGAVAFVTVHLEPNSDRVVEKNLEPLEDLVELAGRYGVPLTLMVTGDWAQCSQNHGWSGRWAEWEKAGHEVALHHHGLSHAVWDGYTNDASKRSSSGYRGDMDELFALIEGLTSTPVVTGSMTDEETDWVKALRINTTADESQTSSENLVSTPGKVTLGGSSQVLQLTKAAFGTGRDVDVSLSTIVAQLGSMKGGEVMGLTLSDPTLAAELGEIEELFRTLKDSGVRLVRVKDMEGM